MLNTKIAYPPHWIAYHTYKGFKLVLRQKLSRKKEVMNFRFLGFQVLRRKIKKCKFWSSWWIKDCCFHQDANKYGYYSAGFIESQRFNVHSWSESVGYRRGFGFWMNFTRLLDRLVQTVSQSWAWNQQGWNYCWGGRVERLQQAIKLAGFLGRQKN